MFRLSVFIKPSDWDRETGFVVHIRNTLGAKKDRYLAKLVGSTRFPIRMVTHQCWTLRHVGSNYPLDRQIYLVRRAFAFA